MVAQATQEAGKFLVDRVLVPGLIGAVTLPLYVLSATSLIDSTWAVVIASLLRRDSFVCICCSALLAESCQLYMPPDFLKFA